ncbi:MAG: hypothetical protein K8T20_13635 [Planctomycetes bacterium]|nr:hypothetical protein [Planctomycetota bacterium]
MKRVLALVLAAAVSAAAQPAASDIDVSGICGHTQGRPGPTLGFKPPTARSADLEPPSADGLANFIRTTIDPTSWDADGAAILGIERRLEVTQSAENLKRVLALVAFLEARFERTVVVDADVYAVSPSLAGELSPGILTAEAARSLDDAAADPKTAALLHSLRISLRSSQRGHQSALKSRTMVQDRAALVAPGAAILDPRQGRLEEGASLDVRPWIGLDGSVVAEIQLAVAKMRSVESFELPAESGGPLALPVQDILDVRTVAYLPAGSRVLVALMPAGADHPGWSLAVVVQARVEAGKSPAPPDTAAMNFRAFDIGTLLALPVEFAGPRLGAAEIGWAPVNTSEIEMPGADARTNPETLVQLLHNLVSPESWQNDGAVADCLGDQLVVYGPPALLDAVATYLATLERPGAAGIAVDNWAIALPTAEWAARRDLLQRPGGFTDELFGELMSAVQAGHGRLVATSGAVGRPCNRNVVSSGTRRRVLHRWIAEVAPGSSAATPVIEPADDGFSFAFDPSPTSNGALSPGLQGQWARIGEPKRLEGVGKCGPLQVVEGEESTFEVMASVPAGRPFLAGTAVIGEGEKAEVMVFLVRARPLASK